MPRAVKTTRTISSRVLSLGRLWARPKNEELEMADANDFNTRIIEEFRGNAGVVGGPFEGATLLILHSRGAKSGAERLNRLLYFDVDGGGVAIIASAAGARSTSHGSTTWSPTLMSPWKLAPSPESR